MNKKLQKIIVAVVILLGNMNLAGCGLLYNAYEEITSTETKTKVVNGDSAETDENETGAWNEGMFWCGNYCVNLECPEAGHPSGAANSEWSTGYKLDDGRFVNVDFFSREGSVEERIVELENDGATVKDGVLWDNSCDFYTDTAESVTIVLIKVDDNNYIEIAFEDWDGNAILFEDISEEFTLSITEGI